jgi:hypothetical protein
VRELEGERDREIEGERDREGERKRERIRERGGGGEREGKTLTNKGYSNVYAWAHHFQIMHSISFFRVIKNGEKIVFSIQSEFSLFTQLLLNYYFFTILFFSYLFCMTVKFPYFRQHFVLSFIFCYLYL